jgi:hypothetical protein
MLSQLNEIESLLKSTKNEIENYDTLKSMYLLSNQSNQLNQNCYFSKIPSEMVISFNQIKNESIHSRNNNNNTNINVNNNQNSSETQQQIFQFDKFLNN